MAFLSGADQCALVLNLLRQARVPLSARDLMRRTKKIKTASEMNMFLSVLYGEKLIQRIETIEQGRERKRKVTRYAPRD